MPQGSDAPAKSSEARLRNVYLVERIRVLRAEVQELLEERRTVAEALRSDGLDRSTPEAKALRVRRVYLSIRPEEARAEIARAQEERQSLAAG